ncbi:Glucan endo-1,3-beta-glucosidase [Dichanthelium oligosanthes]|uniref:glucan endo-1,3-beta-D-glucosidase n=1 Tax=Dichanthelium oligosanthes TaxID=888268 RepID=A0A1E5WMX0_9POAL|nr:Glucan endo-1,3-beta-glucosidase [Dichanthelium oligosanthes]
MAPPSRQGHAAAVLSVFLLILLAAPYTAAIGVNYGTKGDNLPPPAKVASFLANRTRINRVKLFDTNADMVRAFAGTGIAIMVTAGNGDIPKLATKDGAVSWVSANVAPYYPATDISLVAVGNEIMATADKALINNLVPAMRTLKAELVAAGFPKIRVSTPHSLGILSVSEPPSASRFRDGFDRAVFAPMLEFHRQTRSPFMVNPYPYFGYNGDTLAYALARPNPGVPDPGTGITYTSMFEAQLDSVFSAMKKLGFGDVEIAVGETGWPSKAEDGQVGVSTTEAAEYNRYLIGEASAGSGTPLMPKRTFETYIFSLFNENLKDGPVAERNFGLFQADLTPVYDVGLMKDGTAAAPAPAATLTSTEAGAPEPAKAHNASKATKKHDKEAAAAPAEVTASAPAPASGDDASPEGTGPSPSGAPAEGDSTDDDKTPEEGGDAPAAAAAAGESSEAAAKDGDAEGSTEKSDTTPAPAGAASAAADLIVPVSSILTAALSLALHM